MKMLKIICMILILAAFQSAAALDPNINYLNKGSAVSPWELGLNYGKTKYIGESVATVRSSLQASPAKKSVDGDAVRFKWKPKGIKNEWGSVDSNILTLNVTNKMKHTDLTSVIDRAALTFDVKVNKVPKENVELMMECGWNWKCRTKFPLKNAFKRAPKGKWVSIPIPLKCLANEGFDFSKVTTIFSLQTVGKLDIEISNIQLTGLASGEINCG
ncbi:glycan-binding surface protein [Psychrosphaera algicola]|uniref:Glycoside hydrolase n=1 Tax=Psychrosphaera algicola TaxID=3023714 RepID=A0ABT5F7R6_9GAMM|nr:putative glycoside hydrolase [Psychrosphaera sp. G1-22]MDC2887579.1 putative glycoside hydrolase [Psychrosphaera sp. G1-22]